MPDEKQLKEAGFLDKDELIRLSIHDVTEEAKKRLYRTVYIMGAYAAILLSICAWFAYSSIDDAITKIFGTTENPTDFVKATVEKQVEKRTEPIMTRIFNKWESSFGEMSRDIEEQTKRKIDYEAKKIDSRLGEMFRDSTEETNRMIDYRIRQILLNEKDRVISEQKSP